MHLINDNIGGPGNDVRNLVPGPRSINTTMEKYFENPIKRSMGKDKDSISANKETKSVIWVDVDVQYYEENNPDNPWAKKLILTAGMHYYDINKKQWQRDKTKLFSTSYNIPYPRFVNHTLAQTWSYRTGDRHALRELNVDDSNIETKDLTEITKTENFDHITAARKNLTPADSVDTFIEKLEDKKPKIAD